VTKKLTGRALARFEAGRDIWQEVLDGVREIKAGRGKRTSVEARSPMVRALEIRPHAGGFGKDVD
jgi:putative transcriptional regulator